MLATDWLMKWMLIFYFQCCSWYIIGICSIANMTMGFDEESDDHGNEYYY